MNIRSGFAFYGQDVGILVNASQSPRVPGDAGHSATFSYPVRYQITGTSFMDLVDGSDEAKQKLLAAAQALKEAGCRGILADCGLMSLYQQDIARATNLPFVGSSLIQIPLAWQMVGCQGKVGIVTGHSAFLKEHHLRASGWSPEIPLAIEGMEHRPHFARIVIEGGLDLDPDQMRADVVNAARALIQRQADVRILILECSNLASYSWDVSQAVGLPVLDTISAANLLAYSLSPTRYL